MQPVPLYLTYFGVSPHANTYRRQDLGLGDDAVGEAVLAALGGDLSPGDLKTRDPLMRRHPGHAPQEAAGDVSLVDGEGGGQVFRLRQNLWNSCSWWKDERFDEKSKLYFYTVCFKYL